MQEALPHEVNDRLAKERNVWIVTVRRDGRPHMVPVWFVWFESKIYVCIEPESVKGRNILLNRNVTLALEDGSHPLYLRRTRRRRGKALARACRAHVR